jgi:uncharacterized protein (TIGR02611 family)
MGQVAQWVWFPFGVTLRFIARNGRRLAVTIAGAFLVLVGLVMLVLPGPGVLVVLAGLAVLATEYVWAQRMLNYAKTRAGQARDTVLRRRRDERGSEGPVGPDG